MKKVKDFIDYLATDIVIFIFPVYALLELIELLKPDTISTFINLKILLIICVLSLLYISIKKNYISMIYSLRRSMK